MEKFYLSIRGQIATYIILAFSGFVLGWCSHQPPKPETNTEYVTKTITKQVPVIKKEIETRYEDKYIQVESAASGSAGPGVRCAITGVCDEVSVSSSGTVSENREGGEAN